jgi:hypothetical protein
MRKLSCPERLRGDLREARWTLPIRVHRITPAQCHRCHRTLSLHVTVRLLCVCVLGEVCMMRMRTAADLGAFIRERRTKTRDWIKLPWLRKQGRAESSQSTRTSNLERSGACRTRSLRVQGTGSHSSIQGDHETGRIPRCAVLAVVLALGGIGRPSLD